MSEMVQIQWSVRNGSDMSLQSAPTRRRDTEDFIINESKGKFSSNIHFAHCRFQENRPPGSKDKSFDMLLY